MEQFFAYTVFGLFLGAAYSIAASGLVLTYTTTRVFNLAHGAISMVAAYLYWQLHVKAEVPTWAAVLLILLVIAPAFGIVLDRVVMRGLGEAPVSVSLVVTLGLFMILIGVAQKMWPADQFRTVNYFFGSRNVKILGVHIIDHYLLTIGISAAVAAALYVLLNRTRIGTAMRAAVDNRELLELFGANASRVSMLSWAVGAQLAALAGILLVAYTGLDYYTLTFLVITAFGAAMLGRLRSLPLTFAGAIALGLATAYVQGYIHGSAYVQTGLQSSLPTFLLFAVVIFIPQVRLRVGQVKGILAANVPSVRTAAMWSAVLLALVLAVLPLLGINNKQNLGDALVFGILMLSLVLLTGYGGYVSLCQLTFFGVGVTIAAKWSTTSPLIILFAMLVTAAVGALVALPVLRLTGLYLALATLAFGQLMDKLVFQADYFYGFGKALATKRVSLLGYDLGDGAYVFFIGAVFVVVALGLLFLRRGAIGRLLIALRDSPAAAGTLGLNQRWFRVGVFSASAGLAGLAGSLYAGMHSTVNAPTFSTLQSLPLLLIAVVAGVTSMTGALAGGVLYMLFIVLPRTMAWLAGVEFIVIGIGAILLARDPNGLVNFGFRGARAVASGLPMPRQLRRFTAAPPPLVVEDSSEDESIPEAQVAGHGVA
jgi:branched-chain amino acid transport system permease protein